MNDKKKIIIISLVVVFAAVLILLVGLLGGKKGKSDSTETTMKEQTEEENNNSEKDVEIDNSKKESEDAGNEEEFADFSKPSKVSNTTQSTVKPEKENDSVVNGTESEGEVSAGSQTASGGGGGRKPSKPEEKKITFPHNIPGTSLCIEYIDAYDGVFMEDGSDKEVSGIGAMVVTNKGSSHVEYARLTVKTGSGDMKFEVSTLPAGASAVLQESSAAKYTDKKVKDIVCETAVVDSLEMSKDQVSVVENEDGSLQVTNLTDSTIPCVRVFYKFYMEDEEIYVGGITYTSKIKNLGAGKSCTVNPTHYVAGSSKVMMVRTYETAE